MKPWLPILVALAASLASAATIVTGDSQVTLQSGDSLLFYISSNYASHAPAGDPYPGEMEILLGGLLPHAPVAPLPGTSAVYISGELFSGVLESLDGSVSLPLFDANAARLGLPPGDLLLGPGERSGGSYSGPVALLAGTAVLSSPQAAALFASGEAVVRIRDLSGGVTFGYPGSPVAAAFSASLIGAGGVISVGASCRSVGLQQAPEPAAMSLLLIGLCVVGARLPRRSSR